MIPQWPRRVRQTRQSSSLTRARLKQNHRPTDEETPNHILKPILRLKWACERQIGAYQEAPRGAHGAAASPQPLSSAHLLILSIYALHKFFFLLLAATMIEIKLIVN